MAGTFETISSSTKDISDLISSIIFPYTHFPHVILKIFIPQVQRFTVHGTEVCGATVNPADGGKPNNLSSNKFSIIHQKAEHIAVVGYRELCY